MNIQGKDKEKNYLQRKKKWKDQYDFCKETILFDDDYLSDLEIHLSKNRSGCYIFSLFDKYYKIGSAKNIYNRLISLERTMPEKIKIIKILYSEKYREIEKDLHFIFKNKQYKTEWFLLEKKDLELLYEFD